MFLLPLMAGNDTTRITSAAIQSAVNADSELAEKARALAHKALDIADDYLSNGSAKLQLDVIKSIMPAIGRGMNDKGESEELVAMRERLDEVMQLVMGQTLAS